MATIKVRKYKNSVYVIYSHRNKKFKLFTRVKADDKYWINNTLRKNCPDYDLIKIQIDVIQNPFIESFNGSFRDVCLNSNWFLSLLDAKHKIEQWRQDYNEFRPHSSLNDLTPNDVHS
jgi:hypothetical protein